MNYEKAYKEALERAREFQKSKDGLCVLTAESIFPELAESEDERIKETLIDYFKIYKKQEECGIKTFFGIPTDNIIAWLEKQGEKKATDKIEPKTAGTAHARAVHVRGTKRDIRTAM